jgi:hypothetical protein
LHSFKDFVTYVQTYLPDRFPPREAVGPDDQWSIELAFVGLRQGLVQATREKGELTDLAECMFFVDEAEKSYRAGDVRGGFTHLENVRKLLRRIPTR